MMALLADTLQHDKRVSFGIIWTYPVADIQQHNGLVLLSYHHVPSHISISIVGTL